MKALFASASPEYFEYGNQARIICGPDSINRLPDLFRQIEASRPLIITDNGVAAAGLLDRVLNALTPELATGPVLNDVPQRATLETVQRMALIFKESRCDAIVAVGGGTVMDTAKGINLAVREEVEVITRLAGICALTHSLYPLIAVPTTAGSGAEATATAVLTETPQCHKWFFISPFLTPSAVVIDPLMTATLSPEATAAGALTAVGHAVEACISLARNPHRTAHAFTALELIRDNLFRVINTPEDLSGRTALSLGACLAGMAVSGIPPGISSALAHGISGITMVPHSVCISIILSHGLAYHLNEIEPIAAELLCHLAGPHVCGETPRHLRALRLVATVTAMNRKLFEITAGRHPMALKALPQFQDYREDHRALFDQVAEMVQNSGAPLLNSLKDKAAYIKIMEQAWQGSDTSEFSSLQEGEQGAAASGPV